MTPPWSSFIRQAGDRRILLTFGAGVIASLYIGFGLVKPAVAERLIVKGGYYYILGVFAWWLFYMWQVAAPGRSRWRERLRRPGNVGWFLIGATVFAVWADAFAHKVLFDEYVTQGTAWHMHLTKEIGTPVRAYDIQGSWLAIDTFLDKRPYFFPFLISLLHDLTGFRVANVFVLNVGLAFVLLGSTYWLVRALTDRTGPALLAVAMLASVPLFGQNVTGANMELLNLTMIAVTMVAAVLYIRAPARERLSLLVLSAVLLAQTRYESVLFVVPVAAVVVLGWIRAGRLILPWPALVAPLLLVPYLWHDRYVTNNPLLWQLKASDVSRFAWRYVGENLEGARHFFFSATPGQPNSLWLAVVGLAAAVWGLVQLGSRWRTPPASRPRLAPAILVLSWFGVTIGANLLLLMFYYWGRLDDPVAARFALPGFFLLALATGWFVHSLEQRRIPAIRVVSYGLGIWFLGCADAVYANRYYTTQNLVLQEVDWELELANAQEKPMLWITTKATTPFILEKIPALNTVTAAARAPQIAWHLREKTFKGVFVSQVLRPTSADGDRGIDPDDVLPAGFQLRPIAEKRFGGRWIRISRVEGIAGQVAATGSEASPAGPQETARE